MGYECRICIKQFPETEYRIYRAENQYRIFFERIDRGGTFPGVRVVVLQVGYQILEGLLPFRRVRLVGFIVGYTLRRKHNSWARASA